MIPRAFVSNTGALARVTLVLGALAAGCDPPDGEPPADSAPANAIEQHKERGPVQVTLHVEPREPTYADRIAFSIAAQAEKGVNVRLPSPGEKLGGFLIRDFLSYPASARADGKVESRHEYVLEVLTSGEYTIPALEVAFTVLRTAAAETAEASDAGATASDADAAGERLRSAASPEDGQGTGGAPGNGTGGPPAGGPAADTAPEEAGPKEYRILTDPVTIQVKSLEDVSALESLRPIAGPASAPAVPPSLRWPLAALGALVALGLLVALAVFVARRPRVEKAPPPVPPEELAYRELEWLVAQGFTDRGELKEFYFHLSRIVREYIERRFGLRAPESTTEEFLDDLSRSSALSDLHKHLLSRFLERADMVKFARYAPAAGEIEASFDAAKSFIGETRHRREEATVGDR